MNLFSNLLKGWKHSWLLVLKWKKLVNDVDLAYIIAVS
jgi:hypothetical protein